MERNAGQGVKHGLRKARALGAAVAMSALDGFPADHAPLSMIAMEGPTHVVRYANPAFCRLVRLDRAAVVGRPFADAVPDSIVCECLTLLDRVYRSQTAENPVEHCHQNADGEMVHCTYVAWPVFDEGDSVAGVMLQVSDTSDVARDRLRSAEMDDQMRAVNQALLIAGIREQESAEVAATAQQHLQRAQRMDGIGKLAGGIAHDFNNMLTAILGFAQLAADGLPPEEPVQKYLETIKSAGERASLLTSQLLALARKQMIVPRVLDIGVLVNGIATILQGLIGDDVRLVLLPQAEEGRVNVDPGQFGQVLINLAMNARDAMPRGGRLTIETANVSLDEEDAVRHSGIDPGEYVVLAVTDTGTGFTGEALDHLFEPFFTTKEPGHGTGLGLATCYGIVKQNGGFIQVDSEPDTGTIVRILLPRVHAVPSVDRVERVARSRGATETVLLVEDEALVREVGAQALRREGYLVLEAQNGGEALQVWRDEAGEIDLVVTDLVMPVMGGRELAERLYELRANVRVLFVSGYTDDEIVRRGVNDKRVAFLHKPFTVEELLDRVREVIDSAPVRAGP